MIATNELGRDSFCDSEDVAVSCGASDVVALRSSSRFRRGHIVILVENLPVPFDRRVWMESLALTEAGYKVSVISPMAPDDPVADRVIDGVHVYRYDPPSETQSKLGFVREFAYCYWQTRKLLARIWREDSFDVIQTCNPPDTFWPIARRYKKHGVKYVFDHHDLCPELYESKYGRRDMFYRGLVWLERKQFQTADAVIATNESYRRIAMERGGKSSDDVVVVRSGPRLDRFVRVAPNFALRRGRKHLCVYLGVMGAQDGVDYALRAIRSAISVGLTDTSYAFIGNGDEFSRLVRMSEELKLEDYVEFTGRISDEDLCRYLSTADIALAPDPKNPLNDVSSMNKIVEYMAMQLPIISFDLIESRYTAGEAAIYIQDDDVDAMGAAMTSLIRDPQRRQRMGTIGRQRVEQYLAWDHSRLALVRLYNALVSQDTRRPLAESVLQRFISPAMRGVLSPLDRDMAVPPADGAYLPASTRVSEVSQAT